MNEIYAAGVLAAAINRIPYANKFVKDKIVWVEIAGDSPHATKKNAPFIVGRGPVPRHRSGTRPPSPSVGQEHLLLICSGADAPELQMGVNRSRIPTIAGDRPPRYGGETPFLYRRAWALACHTRMRAGFPRHRSGTRPPLLCRSRAPALDPFGSGRSRTTDGGDVFPVGETSRSRFSRATVKTPWFKNSRP